MVATLALPLFQRYHAAATTTKCKSELAELKAAVFKVNPALTDEDIDAIIKKGERATEDLNQKMQQFADGAMKFTLDG